MSPQDFHVLDYVDDYLHESVTPEYAAYLERHVEDCTICKAALDEARKRQAAVEAVATVEASESLIQATLRRVDQYEGQRSRRRRVISWTGLSGLAASILVLAGLHLYYWQMSPTPYDVMVLGQNQLYAAAPGSVRVRVMDQNTRRPLVDVPVRIQLAGKGNEVVELARFRTNAQGTGQPMMQLPDWPEGDYQLVVVAEPNGRQEALSQPVKLKRSWKVMLSSDKPVYQPGQEIHLRSLSLLQPALKPVAGHEATFSITDPKGNVIFKRKDVTSSHGIAAADCPLASEITEGPYTIACKVGDTESKLTVEVKKYVLPKFGLQVKGLKDFYKPGDKVSGTVQANYFAGQLPVKEADVTVKVVTTDAGPEPIHESKVQTNDQGEAGFDFKLPDALVGRPQDNGDARFAVEVVVRDPAGTRQSKVASRVVTAQPLKLEVIPEGGALVQGVANKVYVYVSRADGKPAGKARINITGIGKELTTSDLGVASFEITPKERQVQFTVSASDNEHRISKPLELTCGQPERDFVVRTDKAVYTSSETVKLSAVGGGVEPVFVDFIKDGQTILTESIDMTAGKGEYAFDLPASVFGTIELNAYRYGSNEGLPVRKSRVLYVRPADQVKIAVALDQKEYKPGRKAKLHFTLTDREGKPAPGALSLAAVDEAVFAVLDQAPGMEKTFYMLEKQLLEPVYAIYPGWSPDNLPPVLAEDRRELEQAVFAKTARSADATQSNVPPPAPRPEPRPQRRPNRPAIAQPAEAAPAGGGAGLNLAASPYTLQASSFPVKAFAVRTQRDSGLGWVTAGWIGLGLILCLAGYLSLWLVAPRGMLIAHGVGAVGTVLLMCTGIMLLSVGSKSASVAFNKAAGVRGELEAADTEMAVGALPLAAREVRPEAPLEGREPPPPAEPKAEAGGEPVRVREWFPETLLWRPELVTDKDGTIALDVDLADSITDWRLTASAVTADGRLGALENSHIRVFQPFFVDPDLPVALTRGDEVSIPIAVHNHLNKEQTVTLKLADAPWFERLDDAVKSVTLPANAVRGVSFRVRVTKVGNHKLELSAAGAGVGDAVKKPIEVVPDGRRIETVANGTLQQPVSMNLAVPANVIEGSPKAILKVYPSTFSQLVEGLDGIFRMPYGCFEQTSSTTYPNVLALDYLKRTGKKSPEVEAKAKQYIHLGYQRLVGFEVPGGGFDWFGRPPANMTLTAYGLMEFVDMAKVHDVDPQLIERTRRWLLSKRQANGSWKAERGMLNDGLAGSVQRGDIDLSTTAYIAWAVFGGGKADADADATRAYLVSQPLENIKDPYTLALVCNALNALKPANASGTGVTLTRENSRDVMLLVGKLQACLAQLDALKKTSADGKQVWWEQAANSRTTFYGAGTSGNIETTALAALALLETKQAPATTRGALTYIAAQKDGNGTWHSTQATVLALKALVNSAGASLGGEKERKFEVVLGQGKKRQIVIPADQADVMVQLDLSGDLAAGDNALSVAETTDTGSGYQLAFRYHVPGDAAEVKDQPLAITIDYDKTELIVGEVVAATATVVNRTETTAPMIILDLPIPAGFEITPDQLAELVGSKKIEKYQIGARKAVVYLRGLEPNKPLVLRYDLRAKMPVKVAVPAARVYEYYDPDKQATSGTRQMTVRAR